MANANVQTALESSFPRDIVEHIVRSYYEIEANFRLEKWKTSELDAGHFVEAVRRLIEHELFGSYTPFAASISVFNQSVLNRYESSPGQEETRILIPRVLYSMYCIRNKRGVGHISAVSPNRLDATYILHSAKWVLAELVRLSASTSPDDAKRLTEQIVERQVDIIWEDGDTFMVLDGRLNASDRILVCLYRQDAQPLDDLQIRVDYRNKTMFKKLVVALQQKKLLALTSGNICKLSPLGVRAAEELISSR